jgi:hypothetical protein
MISHKAATTTMPRMIQPAMPMAYLRGWQTAYMWVVIFNISLTLAA